MTSDELQKTWQSQESSLRLNIDAEMLLKEVRRNKKHFEAAIFWRDVREVGVCIPLVIYFLYLAVKINVWSLFITAFSVAVVAVFMLIDRINQKKKFPKAAESMAGCIETSLAQVEHQIWLLKNALWWYLLPPGIGISLFWGHLAWRIRHSGGMWLVFILGCFVLLFVVYTGIYHLNQWAVRKELKPRKDELERLLAGMEED